MKIKWIGQGGYVINTANTEIIIDPYLSDVVNRVANRPRLFPAPIKPSEVAADAIICTHNHLDHLDIDAIPEMNKNLRFITTVEGKEKLNEMGFENVQAVVVGDTVDIGDISITAVYANHTVEAFGVIIRADGEAVYISGDTLYDEKLFEVAAYKPDVTFICINGRLGNMNVDEAIAVAKNIGAKVNIPNHYDMFASNSENPLLFTNNISGGFVMEHNKEYSVSELTVKTVNKRVEEIGIVPVIKLNNPERDAAPLAKALTDGGVPVAEVTFRAAGADKAIALMKK